MKKLYKTLGLMLSLICLSWSQVTTAQDIAVVGDYQYANQAAKDVGAMIRGWNPAYVVTLGDNTYVTGSGAYTTSQADYETFIGAQSPANCGVNSRFLPSFGNHDVEPYYSQNLVQAAYNIRYVRVM